MTTDDGDRYRRVRGAARRVIHHHAVPRTPAHARPLALALVLVTLLIAMLAGPVAAVPTDEALRDAEVRVLERINEERAALDLRPIRMDSRIRRVAQARSSDMVDRRYFDHVDPDGKAPWDHLDAASISWYRAGEIIALNHVSPISSAASHAVDQWMASQGHHDQIVSTVFNYAGVGVAVTADGTSYWTVVFIQGPDRTTPTADLTSASSVAGSGRARLHWAGADRRLVTLTAGIGTYDIQRRRAGGTWSIVRRGVSDTAASVTGSRGVRYQFRVRARDRAGNVGSWSDARSVTIR
jgi:uncharacterized protein YkwD